MESGSGQLYFNRARVGSGIAYIEPHFEIMSFLDNLLSLAIFLFPLSFTPALLAFFDFPSFICLFWVGPNFNIIFHIASVFKLGVSPQDHIQFQKKLRNVNNVLQCCACARWIKLSISVRNLILDVTTCKPKYLISFLQ